MSESQKTLVSVVTKKAVGKFSITKPFNAHVHLRDGTMLNAVVPYTARQFSGAVVMPNLTPAITTVELANAYRLRILEAARNALGPKAEGFTPYMTLYLTDQTEPSEIDKAKDVGWIAGVKLYPMGATTNSDEGVTDLHGRAKVLKRMQEKQVPLLMHAEVTDEDIDEYDREKVFIDRYGTWLLEEFPDLPKSVEHITSVEALNWVLTAEKNVVGTVTPQHLLFNRNQTLRYKGKPGLHPHHDCLPRAKRERHRKALVQAVVSGDPRLFAGDDSAPHSLDAKQADRCACGIFNEPVAIAVYTQIFAEHGDQTPDDDGAPRWIRDLDAFLGLNARKFYGLLAPGERLTIVRENWNVPKYPPDATVRIFLAEENLPWKVAD